jgi:hypothetical protein
MMDKEQEKKVSLHVLQSMIEQKRKSIETLSALLDEEIKALGELEELAGGEGADKEPIGAYGDPLPEYNPKWIWTNKIIYAVRLKDKPLQTSEIVKTLEEIQPDIFKYGNTRFSISVYLITLVKNGRLIKYKLKGQKGYYYCHPSWCSEDGQLKPVYYRKLGAL